MIQYAKSIVYSPSFDAIAQNVYYSTLIVIVWTQQC